MMIYDKADTANLYSKSDLKKKKKPLRQET